MASSAYDNEQPMSNGMIVRITLVDFVTYSNVEIYPKAKLNIILGPNGTGKSTFLCAVILGLGGKPTVIGRSSNVADYIKRGSKEAIIEIELFNTNGRNYSIKRKIINRNNSQWFLQGKQVAFKKIEEILSKFNIDINNLCQILPQDRVQDFAKMNKVELLDATQKCVGNIQLFECFEKLKSFKSNSINNKRNLLDIKHKNQIEADKLAKLEEEVNTFRKRQNAIATLDNMKKKVLWLQFEEKEKHRVEFSEQVKKVEELCVQVDAEVKPVQEAIRSTLKLETNITKQIDDMTHKLTNLKHEEKEMVKKLLKQKSKLNTSKIDFDQKIESERNREKEIQECKKQLDIISRTLPKSTENDLTSELKSIEEELRMIGNKKCDLRKEEYTLQQNYSNVNEQLKVIDYKYQQACSIKESKMKLLHENPDLHTAHDWLLNNQHQFKKKIYGPVFLEIDVNNADKAKYVEKCIRYRDLIAFVCEDPEDMSKFFEIIRDKGLQINTLHCSPPDRDIRTMFPPTLPLSEIKQFGFTDYVLDFIKAPPVILKMLCQKFRVHEVPIGSAEVEQNFSSIPHQIKYYFAGDKCIQSKKSRFSGEVIHNVKEIGSARFLSFPINDELIDSLTVALNEKKESVKVIKHNLVEKQQKYKELDVQMNHLKNKKRDLHIAIEHIKTTTVRLKMKEEELKLMEDNKIDVNVEMDQLNQLVQSCLKESVLIQKQLNTIVNKQSKNNISLSLKNLEHDQITRVLTEKEKKSASIKRKKNELVEKLENKKKEYLSLKNEVKFLLNQARKSTDGLTPDDDKFIKKYAPQFSQFAENIDELQQSILQLENEVDLIRAASKKILSDYKEQQEIVSKLRGEVEKMEVMIGSEEQELNALKENWFTTVLALLDGINLKFSDYLSFLGCSGSVELDHGKDPEDYENYGVSIKVKFRNDEPLQELNAYVQSGGERSLTTAIFLLSLQNIIKVPFRFVDEINQGMDAFNEKRVYFLITCAVCKDPQAQYFLITPKWLEDMKLSVETTIHVIYAGAFSGLNSLDDTECSVQSDEEDMYNPPFGTSVWSKQAYFRALGI
ncbi:structural maintenance of chromosomes protein 5 [Cimex lectularius]|uniref:Structural maintenance of chromosomes protein 5 n=1 Tax=Cimex lectularius TaxID=79782 RepID=A0A8I6RTQ8_CIMLE|nr:structural maintenance of chromosomes protein 5 [Cimex lectularius]